jgi:hypothetical protein
VLGAGLAILLALRWTKADKFPESLKWIIGAQCVAQAISLLRYW